MKKSQQCRITMNFFYTIWNFEHHLPNSRPGPPLRRSTLLRRRDRYSTRSDGSANRDFLKPPRPDTPRVAIARPIVTFSSLLEAEDNRQGRSIDEVAFQVDEQTSLVNAAEIQNITRPGVHGFELVNPELLDWKSRTKQVWRRPTSVCLKPVWSSATTNSSLWRLT